MFYLYYRRWVHYGNGSFLLFNNGCRDLLNLDRMHKAQFWLNILLFITRRIEAHRVNKSLNLLKFALFCVFKFHLISNHHRHRPLLLLLLRLALTTRCPMRTIEIVRRRVRLLNVELLRFVCRLARASDLCC